MSPSHPIPPPPPNLATTWPFLIGSVLPRSLLISVFYYYIQSMQFVLLIWKHTKNTPFTFFHHFSFFFFLLPYFEFLFRLGIQAWTIVRGQVPVQHGNGRRGRSSTLRTVTWSKGVLRALRSGGLWVRGPEWVHGAGQNTLYSTPPSRMSLPT